MDQCPYKVLQIERNATVEEIKRAFHKLALSTHPDKNPNGEQMFKKVNAAYAILMNKVERRKYDAQLDRRSRSSCDFTAFRSSTSTDFTDSASSGGNGGRSFRSAAAAAAAQEFYQSRHSAAATREFVNNIMREDREREMKAKATKAASAATSSSSSTSSNAAKPNGEGAAAASSGGGPKDPSQSFASWYREAQKDWAAEELAQEKLKQDLEKRASQAAYEEYCRKERMRDIEEERVRGKQQEREQRDVEQERAQAMRQAYERRKQEVQEEIESQEKDLKDRLNRLGAKWAKDTDLNRHHPHAQSAPNFSGKRHSMPTFDWKTPHAGDAATTDNGGKGNPESKSTSIEPSSSSTDTAQPNDTSTTGAENTKEEEDEIEKTLLEVRMQRAALRACRAQMKVEEAQMWREVQAARAERIAVMAQSNQAQTGFRYATTPLDYCEEDSGNGDNSNIHPNEESLSQRRRMSAGKVASLLANLDRYNPSSTTLHNRTEPQNSSQQPYRPNPYHFVSPSSVALQEARRQLEAEELMSAS